MKKLQNQDSKYKVNKFSNSKKKKTILIITIFILILLIIGISYAAYDYSFVGKESKLESGSVSIKFLESNTNVISLKNSLPEADKVGKREDSFDFAVTTKASYNTGLKYNLSVEKLSVSSGYTSLNDNEVKIYLTDNSNNVLVEPTLISNLSNKLLYTKTNNHSSSKTEIKDMYKLRVWIDQNVDSSSWTKDSKFEYKFKIGLNSEEVEQSLDTSGANAPVLVSGMIPVYYDETSETWKKADSSNKDNNWYNYDSKKWANSVTVSNTNRSTYQKAAVGTEIPMNDILTMEVWIPRYKYKVWNYNSDGTKTSNEQQIEITFENGTAKTGEISCQDAISGTDGDSSETCKLKATNSTCTDATCNNKTYTHPAFTFGNDEIKGFWIGKFELTGTISSITIKPNLSSLGSQTVSSFETNIMNMKNNNSQYGFSTNADTHMIKNSEWGAVAYLSHSKYGTCTSGSCKEIGINNNSNFITGCGASSSSSSSTTCNSYNTSNGVLASTTGNIYGVYDMSGGATEYAMANTVSNDGTTMMSGYSVTDNSGYTGKVYNRFKYTSYTGIDYPDIKYYDKYSFSESMSSIKRSKLGDGIKEVYKGDEGWYGDYSYLASSESPWFLRGGNYNRGAIAGAFYSSGNLGNASSGSSSRLVITP